MTWILLLALALPAPARAKGGPACKKAAATRALREGVAAQKKLDSEDALAAYTRCLKAEPRCVPCQYEIGWTYWSRGEFGPASAAWEKTLELAPGHAAAATWLPRAKDKLAEGGGADDLHVPIGTSGGEGALKLELIARFQNWDPSPAHEKDRYDTDIFSPKSVRFLPGGEKVYVNSLEGQKTVVYDPRTLQKLGAIEHTFGKENAALFHGESTVYGQRYLRKPPAGNPNLFSGKPVESALSHGAKYLWVPYYRRDWDQGAGSPSAVAVIDTATDSIVRVMPAGPIPKYVAVSPDDRWVAIVHWGDNTVALIDVSSGDPAKFAYARERLVVERVLPQSGLLGEDRDSACGFCLRGTVFTPDGKTLLVARMGGGGIAGFDVETRAYLGSVMGMAPTPRHLVVSRDGRWLYFSSNRSGYVTRAPLDRIVGMLRAANRKRIEVVSWDQLDVGSGARTLEESPDGKHLFVAVNGSAELVAVDALAMKVVARVRADAYTVGLDVSPDGTQVWTTSQGRDGKGGNSVNVFAVRAAPDEPLREPGRAHAAPTGELPLK